MHRILTTSLIAFAASPALAEQGGMPQLDPTWFASQLFWLVVSFTVLYLIVSMFISPRVGGVLSAREQAINEAIALAEKFKKEADATKGNFEQVTNDAKAKAAQIMAEAQAEFAKEAAMANDRLTEQLDKKIAASDAELKKTMTRALAGVEAAAVPLAQAMAEKLLGQSISEAQVQAVMTDRSKAA